MSTLGMGNPQMPEGEAVGSGDIVSFVKRRLWRKKRAKTRRQKKNKN